MKHKNKQKSSAIVVYKAAPKPHKNQKNKTHKIKSKAVSSGLDVYRAALADPFSLMAQGARVPDMYSVPTTTRHITRSITLTSNASGECDLVVLPSAYQHCISTRASIVSGSSWTTADGATLANAAVFTPAASLSAQITNYRIVGYGVKVFGVASMTSTQGKVLMATIPLSSWINDKTANVGGISSTTNNASAAKGNTLVAYGIPASAQVVDVSSLPNLPNCIETSMVRVTENPMTIIPKISSPESFNFRQSTDSGIGFNINNQTSATYVQSGDASYLRVAGHEAVVIAATGLSATSNVLEVEICYHLEGTPVLGTSSIIGSDTSASFVNPTGWMSVINTVAKLPAFRDSLTSAGNSFFPGLGTLANRFF